MQRIEYLKQADIFQNQHGSIENEQIKPSSLYEISLKQENNNKIENKNNYYTKNYQLFTTNKYEKAVSQCDKPTYFSTNLAESTSFHNGEISQWLPKQDDSPFLETENNNEDNDSFSKLLKKVNEALETHDEVYSEEKELLNKIDEVLKTGNRKIGNKVNKMHVDESNRHYRNTKSHDLLPYDEDTERVCGLLQVYEKRAPFEDNCCRMYENVNHGDVPCTNYVPITDDSTHENELKSLIRKYASSRNISRDDVDEPTRAYRNGFYNPARLNNESNTIANLEEQFTGASLEYWGNNSIDSIEHSLTQSEWNILKSPNESMNWLQYSFNQSNWLRSNTSSPNLRQRDLYA